MVVISQCWIQHLSSTQIMGYCYLRVGSELAPDLACSLYTAIVTALAEIQGTEGNNFFLSGIYGYRFQKDGIGIIAVQNDKFRVILLCEGLLEKGIPILEGKILKKVQNLFNRLEEIINEEKCICTRLKFRDESFWFNLLVSTGFGEQIQIDEMVTDVYPLRFIKIKIGHETDDEVYIRSLEDTKQGSLGYGWQEVDELIARNVQGIYHKPKFSFQVYQAFFQQMSEFTPDFSPNTVILTFHQNKLDANQLTLVAFLFFKQEELKIHFCLPLTPDLSLNIEDSRTVHSYLRSFMYKE
ncbi:MAG: hypothetical protein ACFFCW_39890 [Candidatus Hodarchaeota archaeon]